jgi:glutamate dehydrogenase (NAD(P)+)
MGFETPSLDDLGPELVAQTYDPETDTRGIVVVDNTSLGPAGGGARMAPDVTVAEVARLARAMTYKFGIIGFPRGGCKSGIVDHPGVRPEIKAAKMRAFGRAVRPLLVDGAVAIGPDMGITVNDVSDIYAGAGVAPLRSGLFARMHEGDPSGYHFAGFGVAKALQVASEISARPLTKLTVALEGFGQVGVGTARYVTRAGGKLVAVSTALGALYDERGIDFEKLNTLRREVGDRCVLSYEGGERIAPSSIYFLPVDAMIPGARPDVITSENVGRVQAKIVVSAGNVTITDDAQELLHQRGVLVVPDSVASAGAAIASWVDFFSGTVEQGLGAIDRILTETARQVLRESQRRGVSARRVVMDLVRERIMAARGQTAKSFEQSKAEIGEILGL